MAVKEADEASDVSVEVLLICIHPLKTFCSQLSMQERLVKYSFNKLYTGKSMYIDDQWASGKETRKRKGGARKKTQDNT